MNINLNKMVKMALVFSILAPQFSYQAHAQEIQEENLLSEVDAEAPTIDLDTLTVSKKEATIGEEVTISLKVNDASDIKTVTIVFERPKSGNTTSITEEMIFNTETEMYEYKFLVDENTQGGIWKIDKISCCDILDNSNDYFSSENDFSNANFVVSDENQHMDIERLENVTFFDSDETIGNRVINGDVYINSDAIVRMNNVTINGNVYILGAIIGSEITVNGDINCTQMIMENTPSVLEAGTLVLRGNCSTPTLIILNHPVSEIPIRYDGDLNVSKEGNVSISGATLPMGKLFIEGNEIQLDQLGRFKDEINVGQKEELLVEMKLNIEYTITGTLTVNPIKPTQLIIDSLPNKLDYILGENLDLTGLSVSALYDDGSTQEISNYRVNGNTNQIGTVSIQIEYAGVTTFFEINVTNPIQSVELNKSELTLTEEMSEQLVAVIDPVDATDQSLEWSSSNENVATVDQNGKVTAVGEGTAEITVTTTNGLTATCTVTVLPKLIEITDIYLEKTEIGLEVGETETLVAVIDPVDATDQSLEWSSSNENVATVDQNGKVTAVGEGTAEITVTTTNGLTATCTVTVLPKLIEITDIYLEKTEIGLEVGETETLVAVIDPVDATDQSLEWSSSNESVATVDQNGKVTAVGEGTAEITVTTTNGLTATCTVTVLPKLIEITDIYLEKTEIGLEVGETETLVAVIDPVDATDQSLEWSSSNENVATVDQNGKVTAVGKGTAEITVTTTNGLTATCTVTVLPKLIEITDIYLDKTEISLRVGETETLVATVSPDDATDQTLLWYSANDNIATVDQNGNVKAVGEGKTTIFVTAKNGIVNSCTVTVRRKNSAVNGWIKTNNNWFFYKNGIMQTGWLYDSGNWYLLAKTGEMLTGWQKVNGTWYYMNSGGAMQTGWHKITGTWYYLNESGAMQTGWLNLSGTWYLLSSSGEMLTKWQKINGSWYYFNESGVMQSGWLNQSGTWYLLADSGYMLTGWQKVNGYWYYFNESGLMQSGWLNKSGTWYLLADSGYMLTGWQKVNGYWYYFNESGVMQTGWLYKSGNWYLLADSGYMLTGWQLVNGTWYYLNDSGVWVA